MNIKKFDYKIAPSIFKTLAAVALCVLVAYTSSNRDAIFWSSVSAIVCMQHNHEHTLKFGGYRFLGTLIGGSVGILTILIGTLIPLYSSGFNSIIISLSALIAIYICNLLSLSNATFTNCIVFLNVVANYDGKTETSSAFFYVTERIFFTLIGILAAYGINRIIYLHRHSYKAENILVKVTHKVKRHKIKLHYRMGLRAWKTAIAIFISVLAAHIFNCPEAIFFCSVAAVTCMQKTIKDTLIEGYHTGLGTMLGGLLGFAVVELCKYVSYAPYLTELIFILFAVFIIIYTCRFFRHHGMIPITSIIFLKMVSHYGGLETTEDMLGFLLNPVLFFTFLGIAIAILVNSLPFLKGEHTL